VVRSRSSLRVACRTRHVSLLLGVLVIDLLYVLGIIAVFVIVGLTAKGVEKL
jgi:hypothetical protein